MARPTKWRKIDHIPSVPYFIPSENQVAELPENILKLEELEAIRLKDLEGLEQEECAVRMEVSRPTFQRILLAAYAFSGANIYRNFNENLYSCVKIGQINYPGYEANNMFKP